ncbi:MAG: hypothetical protein ACLP19_25805 [Xanthobacteraceae bacterium]
MPHDVDHLLKLCRREVGHDLENEAGFGNQQQAATAVGDTLYLVAILSMRDPA